MFRLLGFVMACAIQFLVDPGSSTGAAVRTACTPEFGTRPGPASRTSIGASLAFSVKLRSNIPASSRAFLSYASVRQTPGVLPRAHDERPEMTKQALVSADGLLIERGRRQVPIYVAEVFETEICEALDLVKRCGVHILYF